MKLPWRPAHPCPPIHTSLTGAETSALRRLAAGRAVLEVGSAYGYSTVAMATVAARVVSVDHHGDMGSLDALLANLCAYGVAGKVSVLVGPSAEHLPALPGGSFDLMFIDGDHRKEGVLYDLAEGKRLVRPGGVLAFHDYGEDSCPDVKRALDEAFGPAGYDELVDTLYVARNLR